MVKTEKNSVFNAARFKKFYFHQIREQNLRHFLKSGILGFIGQKQFLLTFLPDLKKFYFFQIREQNLFKFIKSCIFGSATNLQFEICVTIFFYNRYQ